MSKENWVGNRITLIDFAYSAEVISVKEWIDMTRETDILRTEIDTLNLEIVVLKAEVADLKSTLVALQAGLDDRIRAAILRAQGEWMKSQPGEPPGQEDATETG